MYNLKNVYLLSIKIIVYYIYKKYIFIHKYNINNNLKLLYKFI